MKIIFHTSLLLVILVTSLSSCKSSALSYQDYYESANKAYNNGVNFNNPKPKKAKVETCCDCGSNNNEYYADIASMMNNLNSMNKAVDKLEKAAEERKTVKDNQLENGQETEKPISKTPAPMPSRRVPDPDRQVADTRTIAAKPMPDKPIETERTFENENVAVRKQTANAINTKNEYGLKRYSIVAATLSIKDNATRLANTLRKIGESPIIVQNDLGSYYVLLGSYDNEADVLQRKDEINSKYVDKYTPQQLYKTYGIPFSDMWILEKE